MANQNLRAFLIYNKSGFLVGGPLLRTQQPKDGRVFREIPFHLCCDPIPFPVILSSPSNLKLKAFVKYTEAGKVIPNSVVKRTKKPTNGTWLEVPLNNCCFFEVTTTTTTTSTSSSTTTTTTTIATTTTSSTTTTTTTV